MHSVLILSGLLTLASAATIHMPARAPSGKDLFRRESEPTCWKEKYTMSVEVAEKILCTLKEKAEKGEQCCAKEKGQEVTCASDPAEEKKEGEGEKKEGGGGKVRRTEKKEEEKETVSGLYLVTKGEGKQDQCVKAEALVEVVEKIIECCKSEGEGESEDEKKKEEEEKEKEEKEKEEKDKEGKQEGGSGAAGKKMRRTEESKEGEKEGEEKKVGGWQAVEKCEDLYVSLHAGEAWCPEDTEKNICVKEEKEH